ncbi:MAG TPA: hypothetical protein DDW50_07440 [Firmicutes bacterium]|nr:hypothetical protein [Bacillota bacterium]
MLFWKEINPRFLLRFLFYIAGIIFLYRVPWPNIARGPVLCPFQRILGIPCLGCGMTRAFWQILHCHFQTAFAYNALSFLFFPAIALMIFWDIYREIKNLFF